jgi:cephalosporin hydroxylase
MMLWATLLHSGCWLQPARGLVAWLLTCSFGAAVNAQGLGPAWTLVGEDGNAKELVPRPLSELLEPNETAVVDAYDQLFERYSMYCNGRWLGAQVLQDAQDLMYMQHLVFTVKPTLIIETGTYKGGLTFFFATLIESLRLNSRVLSIDRNPPEAVFSANWFCPVCEECVRPWDTEPWQRHVQFLQGWADQRDLYEIVRREAAEPSGPVVVNLDACHEYDCVLVEILLYSRLVTVGSYLVVQDAKLDKLWGKPAVSAAIQTFLRSTSDFVVDRSAPFYGYSQHAYLQRVAATLDDYDLGAVDGSRISLS